MGAAPGSAAES